MNKTILVIVCALLLLGVGYATINSKQENKSTYTSLSTSKNNEQNSEVKTLISPTTQTVTPPTPQIEKDSTGITYGTYVGPKPDVTGNINVGSGSPEPKTIEAKRGQYVSITFTASIRDEVKIEGYNAADNVEPNRESTISFYAEKAGQFPIILVKANKTIGTLVIK